MEIKKRQQTNFLKHRVKKVLFQGFLHTIEIKGKMFDFKRKIFPIEFDNTVC